MTMTDSYENAETNDGGYERPQTNALVKRGFDGVALAGENAATQALIAKATADIQARWVMAMRRPRQMHDVRQAIVKECQRPEFAKEAMYVVPRGDTKITGLSIRFAEMALRCMGNLSCEAQTLFDSDEERVIRVTATDFETNASWHRDITVKKTVERKYLKRGQRPLRQRLNSYGDNVFILEATDEEVATKEAAMISKAARTAILRLIPGNIQSECERLCQEVTAKADAKDPDAAKNEIFDGFAKLNIRPSDIELWLGHAVDRVTPPEITELRNLWIAIRDGEVSWEEAVEMAEKAREKGERVRAPASKAKAQEQAPANGNGQPAAQQQQQQQPAQAQATQGQAQAQPKAEQRKTGGRGTAAAKEQLRREQVPAEKPADAPPSSPPAAAAPAKPETAAKPETPASDDREKEPGWMSGEQPPKEGYENRRCAKCKVVVEVPKTDPEGAVCYACSQS